MKGIFIFLVALLASQLLFGQSSLHKKAERHFHHFEFAAASVAYEELIRVDGTDAKVMERLAETYIKLNHPEKAAEWLSKLCARPEPQSAHLKMYAQVLAANGNYNEAVKWYGDYLKMKDDQDVQRLVASYRDLASYYKDSSFYRITKLQLNTKRSEFSPVFYKDGIVFCSARGQKPEYAWNNSSFIDLFYVQDMTSQAVDFGKPVNSALHEGPACFSASYDTMYFTRNSERNVTADDGIVKLKIFYTVLKNGGWQKPQAFSLNSDAYSVGHPALGPDGTLYFVSDMPGGFGGTDIYTTRLVDGRWTKPVNAGAQINTAGNEMFPFVDKNGHLYFASSGHAGLGGLDVFCAKLSQGKYAVAKNLGYPVNSSRDDFGLVIHNNSGFFSSNRGGDPQDDNIFSFSVDRSRTLKIIAVDAHGNQLENFNLSVTSGNVRNDEAVVNNIISRFSADEIATISCIKKGYRAEPVVLTPAEVSQFNDNAVLKIRCEPVVKKVNIQLLSTDGESIHEARVQLVNGSTGAVSDVLRVAGSYQVELSEVIRYEVVASNRNYRTKTVAFSSEDVTRLSDGEGVKISMTPLSVLFEHKAVGEIVELEIKYDLGKYNIRPDAARELDKLVAYLKRNTSVRVELGSHTDTRGSEAANLTLSRKRAQSAVNYIVDKGIGKNRLISVGYGETDLKVEDAKTEDDHQHNRRTTVKIVGI